MLREGNVIGVLVIERRNPSDFPPEHLALLQTFADQAVIAIENARLFNELQERNREVTEALDQQTAMAEVLGIIASSAVDAQPVLDAIAVRAARLCGAGSAHVLLVRGDEAETVAVSAQGDASLGVRVPIANDIAVGRSILRKEAVAWTGGVSEFLRDWPRAAEIRDVAHFRDRGIDLTRWSFLVVPLVSGNAAVGAVMFFGGTPFSASETALARVFADQAVIAIENARLFNELQDRNRAPAESVQREAALAAVSHRINEHPTDVDGTLQLLAETTRALTDSTSARVWLLDGDSVVSGPGATGDGAHLPPAGIRVPLSASAEVPRAITEGRTIVTDDAFLQNVVADALEYRQISQIRSVMATPLRSGPTYIGTLAAARTEVRPYNAEEVATLEAVAAQAATAIETARAQLALAQRNAEVSEALRRQEATSDILNHISRAPEDLEATLVAIAEVARKLCAAQSGDFWKLEGDRLIDHYSVEPGSFNGQFDGKPSLELPLQEALKTWPDTYARRASVLTEPALTNGPSAELSEIARVMSGHATARVSVYIGDNWEGSLAVTREDPRPFSDAELALLESLADQGAIAIANARLLRELRERTQELEVVSRHKSEFLANMSHELRTPLNAIIGYSELLQEECLDTGNEDFVPDLQKIHSAGRHLLTLISGILDVSKIEAGRMTMYLEDFDVPALIAETEELVRPLVEKNGNTFTVDCPVDAGMMHADLVKCRQVLFNLLSNAAKFTENGAVTLQVRRDDDEQTMSFAVRDTGIGISDEQRERLFETFAQAESNIQRKYGGTGLGLALSRQFCLMMGGDITVSSRPGHGSTFTATLPLSVSESPTGGETAAQTSQEPLRG
jgi:signal transduction histidine kinase